MSLLRSIPNPHNGAYTVEHTIPVPPLCPVTNNPVDGSVVRICYSNAITVLDVTTLTPYLASFIGSAEYRDMEAVLSRIAADVTAALGVCCTVRGVLALVDGQTFDMTIVAGP
jgi:NADPH-dependent 7-cyano-7-deazaguanine reductase QueF